MPSVEAQRDTSHGWVLGARTASGADPAKQARPAKRPRSAVRILLAGLNRLLELSDFSRGDIFRD